MSINLSLLNQPLFGEGLEEDSSYQKSFQNGVDNRISLDGDYPFLFTENLSEEVLKEDYPIEQLRTIPVPSHHELEGYGIPQYVNVMYPWDGKEKLSYDELPKHNPCGVYFKDISIPEDEKETYLEFHGFEAGLYVYCNGEYVGYSSQNFTRSLFRLTPHLRRGKNRLVFIVFKYSFASWLTDQDMWRFSGIFRSVNLLRLEKTHIQDIESKAKLEKDGSGRLTLRVKVKEWKENTVLSYSLSSKEKVAEGTLTREEDVFLLDLKLNHVDPWSDETPNLYTLSLRLKEGEKELESTEIRVGFKRVERVGNQILLNGNRVIFFGVNRHEFTSKTGRVVSVEETREDLLLMKRNNINALRLSHYPNRVELYDLCDELGILLIDENAIETHGTWNNIARDKNATKLCLPGDDKKYEEITIARGRGMYERDKNHASIIMFSLGNESYSGENFRALYRFFKERDPEVLLHYEGCSSRKDYADLSDATSRMYPTPKQVKKILKKDPETPFMLCEYAHAMGNSNGNLDEYLALLAYPNFMLGFIWDFVDQGLYYDGKLCFGGDTKAYPDDDNFNANGILCSDRKENAKMETVKYYYSKVQASLDEKRILIINGRDTLSTEDLSFVYELYEDGDKVLSHPFSLTVLPHTEKEYQVPDYDYKEGKTYIQQLMVGKKDVSEEFPEGTLLYSKRHSLFRPFDKTGHIVTHKKEKGLETFASTLHLTVKKDDFVVSFYKPMGMRGTLDYIALGEEPLLQKRVTPMLYRPCTDNDRMIESFFHAPYISATENAVTIPFTQDIKIVSQDEDEAVVRVIHTMRIGTKFSRFRVYYTIRSDKTIEVKFSYRPRISLPAPEKVALVFPFFKECDAFTYTGLGKNENYQDRFEGTPYGTFTSKASEEYVHYSCPQECGNHMFTEKVSIPVGNHIITFEALEDTFSFSYLPYSALEIEQAHREENLPKSTMNYLTISAFNKGVGGDNSWGAFVHKKYRGKHKKYQLRFLIRVK